MYRWRALRDGCRNGSATRRRGTADAGFAARARGRNDAVAIAAALDAGTEGVVVPRVSSAAEARAAVAAARFPSIGRRGRGPSRATASGVEISSYLGRANDELLLAVQIEARDSSRTETSCLPWPRLTSCSSAPATSLARWASRTLRAQNSARRSSRCLCAQAAGRLTGVFAASPVDAARWHAAGVSLVILGSDLMWLMRASGPHLRSCPATNPRDD